MPKTLYRDTGYTLMHIVEDIKNGGIALPDIQRPFVWNTTKVRDLFDSMYKGFPVGTLVFWETGAEAGTRRIHGTANDRPPKLLIVDGQQRLTSLYSVLTGRAVLTKSYKEQFIRIAFRPSDETFEVSNAAIERSPEFIHDVTELWSEGYKARVRKFIERLRKIRGESLDATELDHYEERIDRVRDLRDFRFQVVELNVHAEEAQVAEIFVRINSEGVQLNQDDFILTLMSVYWEKGRKELEDFCRSAADAAGKRPSPRNDFITPTPNQMLRVGVGFAFRRARLSLVYNILHGKDLETGIISTERRDAQFDELRRAQEEVLDLTNWHEFLKCLKHAGFRSSRMISSETALLYSYVIWLIGRRDFDLDYTKLRSVISRWFFMAHTTGRYTNSPEAQLEADLRRLLDIGTFDGEMFCQELDRGIRAVFTNDFWEISLPNMLDTAAAKSPALSSYWAALNLLDAESLFSGQAIRDLFDAQDAPRSLERHHLFPKGYLRTKGIRTKRHVNSIANMSFIDWPENAEIGDSAPQEYWPAMAGRLDSKKLKQQRYWHALPMGWEQLDYSEFLKKRRKLIAKVVEDGFKILWDEQGSVSSPSDVTDYLLAGESQSVEFKSTARLNLHSHRVDKEMGHAIVKTVCGFINAEGGALLIGVDDAGAVLGLEDDMQTLGSPGRDSYELFLRQVLDDNLSISTAGIVRIRFEQLEGREICVVSAAPAPKSVFAKSLGGGQGDFSDFWVRVGNATKQLYGNEMLEYQERHWG